MFSSVLRCMRITSNILQIGLAWNDTYGIFEFIAIKECIIYKILLLLHIVLRSFNFLTPTLPSPPPLSSFSVPQFNFQLTYWRYMFRRQKSQNSNQIIFYSLIHIVTPVFVNKFRHILTYIHHKSIWAYLPALWTLQTFIFV